MSSQHQDIIDNGDLVDKDCYGRRPIKYNKIPWGALILNYLPPFPCYPKISYRVTVLILTFLCYMNYHMTRKVFSVVKGVLAPNCSSNNSSNETLFFPSVFVGNTTPATNPGWEPFSGSHCKTLLGSVDYSWLFAYAICMFFSGIIGDRINLRYFLTFGMIGSGIGTGLLGVAYYANIHHLYYFILIQLFNGMIQSTGWPGVVAVMGNWFGKAGRGFLMGLWNSHTSVGNILGAIIPSIWAQPGKPWGLAFIVPGGIMICMGIIVFLFLVADPSEVGLSPPKHHSNTVQIQRSNHDSYPTTPIISNDNKNRKNNDNERKPLLSGNEEFDNKRTHSRNSSVSDLIVNSNPYKVVVGGKEEGAVGLLGAFLIPGVIEFSLSLFFAKLVAYTFLFWLPFYVKNNPIDGKILTNSKANLLSTLFDVGGIIGGIFAGGISDLINAHALTCTVMLYLSVPALYVYRTYGHISMAATISLMMTSGVFVNGPYALITTAVSSDLGTHKSLQNNQKAKATVSAIIDGTGSIGAALGPLLAGWISDDFGWDSVFYLLMVSCFLSSLFLSRLLITDIIRIFKRIKKYVTDTQSSEH